MPATSRPQAPRVATCFWPTTSTSVAAKRSSSKHG